MSNGAAMANPPGASARRLKVYSADQAGQKQRQERSSQALRTAADSDRKRRASRGRTARKRTPFPLIVVTDGRRCKEPRPLAALGLMAVVVAPTQAYPHYRHEVHYRHE